MDDDPVDLEILRRHLHELGALVASFHSAGDLESGLRLAREGEFDLVFLDYDLGDATALDFLARLEEAHVDVPVIVLTGHGDQETTVRVMRQGAFDFVTKDVQQPSVLRRAALNAVEKFRLRAEATRSRHELERTVEDLRGKNSEIQSFYHVLSHELKTPLTAIREFVTIVLDGLAGETTPKQREYLEIALRNCDTLRLFLNDLLDVTRIETGKLSMHFEELDLDALVEAGVQALRATAEERGLELVLEQAPGAPRRARADADRVNQVLSNLLTNAFKFTPAGGRVVVRLGTADEGRSARVEVADTGRGIDPARQERIFERLYQVDVEDFAIQGGLGLGLHLCREIVLAHGGGITVESEPGAGSTFTVELPLL
ncbi:MAG: hybrid sensor histidine kinase/response regulator [Planctomycetes bacterium]|nr:hybrid sensor histidine kinase/response regulator [Planctomycetota bacterium]